MNAGIYFMTGTLQVITVISLQDATKFFVSLPSNRLELWFAMESERFIVRFVITSHKSYPSSVWPYRGYKWFHACRDLSL